MKKPSKIMIIDDDPDFVDAIRIILRSAAYDVAWTTSPQSARQKIVEEEPDLIMIDVMMDGLFDGIHLCDEIKSSPDLQRFSAVPVILVSAAREFTGSRFEFYEDQDGQGFKGPDAYLDKPIKPKKLLGTIEALLGR
ncbi:MAG: response regulator [Pseudomonadota bacterium]